MVQGQVLLKGGGTFPILFFQGVSILYLNYLFFAKLCYAFFSAAIIF